MRVILKAKVDKRERKKAKGKVDKKITHINCIKLWKNILRVNHSETFLGLIKLIKVNKIILIKLNALRVLAKEKILKS